MSTAGIATGRLKIYLGYAAGVGKTYKMLEEAGQMCAEGVDVVVGYFEPHGRKDTIALTRCLELIPLRTMRYRDVDFKEMDVDAILARRPAVCVVDELPHTNIPGSDRPKRWEDVQVLLQNGIDVLTTANVQHLESLNDQIWQISGVHVRETVPDWFVQQADEVVMVDLTPRALIHRLERGVIYSPEKAQKALDNFFRESTLSALRELALRQTAHVVEVRHDIESLGEGDSAPERALAGQDSAAGNIELPDARTDRVLILITSDPSAAMIIRRGKRVADFLHAKCYAVYVETANGTASDADQRAVQKHLSFARDLHIETRSLTGTDVASTLVEFAREHRITQIYIARPKSHGRLLGAGRDLVQRTVRLARDMQVTIVAERKRQQSPSQS